MTIIGWIALAFMVFEVVQLVVAQRFIGVEQIRRNLHPLDTPAPHPFWFSAAWVAVLMSDYAFQVALLLVPIPEALTRWPHFIRLAALLMMFVSIVGFILRRRCGIKLGLVVLTFEGAMRAGLFLFVFNLVVLHGAMTPYIRRQPRQFGWVTSQGMVVTLELSAPKTMSGVRTAGSSTGVSWPGR